MKTRGYIIYGIAIYLLFLVGTFPASKAYSLMHKRLGWDAQSIELAGIDGPWWSAKTVHARINSLHLENFSWRLKPLYLFLGRIVLRVQAKASEGNIKSHVGFGFGKVTLKKTELNVPLSILDRFGSQFGVNLDGTATSSIKQLILQDGYLAKAEGVIVLSGVEVMSPQKMRLGDFKVVMVTEDKKVLLTFADNGGPLKAEGVLQLAENGVYDFSGKFLAQDTSQPTLADLISLMGKPDDKGQVSVSMSGTLPKINI